MSPHLLYAAKCNTLYNVLVHEYSTVLYSAVQDCKQAVLPLDLVTQSSHDLLNQLTWVDDLQYKMCRYDLLFHPFTIGGYLQRQP